MNHNLKEKMLPDCYEYSQRDVAEKMFLTIGTISAIEKRAAEKFKKILAERGIDIKDLL
jgi:transcriptional regulator